VTNSNTGKIEQYLSIKNLITNPFTNWKYVTAFFVTPNLDTNTKYNYDFSLGTYLANIFCVFIDYIFMAAPLGHEYVLNKNEKYVW